MTDSKARASITGLPIELRAAIFQYLLPHTDRRICSIRYDDYSPGSLFDTCQKESSLWETVDGEPPTLQILNVNRQFCVEASALLKLLDQVPLKLLISDRTFWRTRPQTMIEVTPNDVWNLTSLLPGIDLSNVKQLSLDILPCDIQCFWTCLSNFLTQLFEKRLLPGGRIRCLKIWLLDMMAHHTPLVYQSGSLHPLYQAGEPIKAAFVDYANALEPLDIIADKIDKLEITLPFWMEHMIGVKALRARLERTPNLDLSFEHVERSARYKGGDWQLREMASLADEEKIAAIIAIKARLAVEQEEK